MEINQCVGRRRVDGVEVDAAIQDERAVKFDFHTGSVYTTLEGCLDKIVDALLRGNPFGDSAETENRRKFEAFLDRVRALRDGKVFPFTVIM